MPLKPSNGAADVPTIQKWLIPFTPARWIKSARRFPSPFKNTSIRTGTRASTRTCNSLADAEDWEMITRAARGWRLRIARLSWITVIVIGVRKWPAKSFTLNGAERSSDQFEDIATSSRSSMIIVVMQRRCMISEPS